MSALFSDGEMVGGSVENTDFTSSDVADSQVTTATGWTTVTPIVDDEPNVSLFTKLSQIAKNVRYLYKMQQPVVKVYENGLKIYQIGNIVTVQANIAANATVTATVPKPLATVAMPLLNATNIVGNVVIRDISNTGSLTCTNSAAGTGYTSFCYITNDLP